MFVFNDLANILKNETIKITLGEEELKIESSLSIKKIEVERYEEFVKDNLIEVLELKIILPKTKSYGINISYGIISEPVFFKKSIKTWNYYIFSESNENIRWGEGVLSIFSNVTNTSENDVRKTLQKMLYLLGFKNVTVTLKKNFKKLEQIQIINKTTIKEENVNVQTGI